MRLVGLVVALAACLAVATDADIDGGGLAEGAALGAVAPGGMGLGEDESAMDTTLDRISAKLGWQAFHSPRTRGSDAFAPELTLGGQAKAELRAFKRAIIPIMKSPRRNAGLKQLFETCLLRSQHN